MGAARGPSSRVGSCGDVQLTLTHPGPTSAPSPLHLHLVYLTNLALKHMASELGSVVKKTNISQSYLIPPIRPIITDRRQWAQSPMDLLWRTQETRPVGLFLAWPAAGDALPHQPGPTSLTQADPAQMLVVLVFLPPPPPLPAAPPCIPSSSPSLFPLPLLFLPPPPPPPPAVAKLHQKPLCSV